MGVKCRVNLPPGWAADPPRLRKCLNLTKQWDCYGRMSSDACGGSCCSQITALTADAVWMRQHCRSGAGKDHSDLVARGCREGFCSKCAPRGVALTLEKSCAVCIEENHVIEELRAHLTCQPSRSKRRCNHPCIWKLHKSQQGFHLGCNLSEDECVLQK